MQSSFNVIKAVNASVNGQKTIDIKSNNYGESSCLDINDVNENYYKEQGEEILASYKQIGDQILVNAKYKADKVIDTAKKNSIILEQEGYEKGYTQGQQNGYEDGYNTGLQKAEEECVESIKKRIEEANLILAKAKEDYNEFITAKEEQIVSLALEMAKVITKKEFESSESILRLIEPILEEIKGQEVIIIRCNDIYLDTLEEKRQLWQKNYNIKNNILILSDPLMGLGNVVIERDAGKTIVGVDYAIEKIETLLNQYNGGGKND